MVKSHESPTPTDAEFLTLIARVRSGDQDAAAELVRRFEPAIRRAVRVRLGDSRLRSAFDSMDICQSILGSFFVRANLGEYDLGSPDQLLKLLATMARNKVADQARRETAGRRDMRRREAVAETEEGGSRAANAAEIAGDAPSPSRVASGRELLEAVRRGLTPEERQIADLRGEGHDWPGIADRLGGTAEGLRKRLSRALARVADAIGLGYGNDS